MEWVETTGKTVEEAKEAALDELGVDEQDAEFEVLEHPKLGLFGRVRSEARVRGRVRPTTPRAKEDRRDRRRRTRRTGEDASASASSALDEGVAPAPRRAPTNLRRGTGQGDTTREGDGAHSSSSLDPVESPGVGLDSPTTPTTRGSQASRPRRRPRGGSTASPTPGAVSSLPDAGTRRAGVERNPAGTFVSSEEPHPETPAAATGATRTERGRDSLPAADDRHGSVPAETPPGALRRRKRSTLPRSTGVDADHNVDLNEGDMLMDVALQDQADAAREFLSGLMQRFGLETRLSASTSDEDDRVDVRVDGDNLGLLIGPKGSTLLALQDLTRAYVQHRTKARNGRMYVDVASYRQKRAQALASFVKKVAADVIASSHPVTLEPMSAADRKVIHDTAAEIPGITTRSEGEDESRHVVIGPAGAIGED